MSTARQDYSWLQGVDAERALNEIDRLRRWKAEATEVLARWDAVWEHAGCPGRLGQDRSEAVREQIDRLRAEIDR